MKFVTLVLHLGSLSSMPGATPYTPVSPVTQEAYYLENGLKKARVLCDYDAKDTTELSLMADEVIINHQCFFI